MHIESPNCFAALPPTVNADFVLAVGSKDTHATAAMHYDGPGPANGR